MSKTLTKKEVVDNIHNWIDTDIVKSTSTYIHWQHDKGSLAYGYYEGLKAAVAQIENL